MEMSYPQQMLFLRILYPLYVLLPFAIDFDSTLCSCAVEYRNNVRSIGRVVFVGILVAQFFIARKIAGRRLNLARKIGRTKKYSWVLSDVGRKVAPNLIHLYSWSKWNHINLCKFWNKEKKVCIRIVIIIEINCQPFLCRNIIRSFQPESLDI